ncbi:Ceramide synthase 3 [Clydaea vesicula]|uniref:Ceramide synthase 3 n=1 Tax=Clydaea vesicula TaxID=447962 RepID=A0AAD5TZ28_9FUNG|nr:Ceramide synthase 3 [Clydaea vesicula]
MFWFLQVKNNSLQAPYDFYIPFFYTLGFAAAHKLIVNFVLKPLSFWLLPVCHKKVKKNSNQTLTNADSAVDINRPKIKKRGKTEIVNDLGEDFVDFVDENGLKKDENEVVRKKFVISCWRFIQYSVCVVTGIYVLSAAAFAFDPKSWFAKWPNHGMSNMEKTYYHIGFGSYAYAIIDIFIQPKQKDFGAMITHHVATLFLIYLSYMWGFHRIGCVILLLHDISDPFMEIAKACLYAKKQLLADIFITSFALVFLFTRVFVYPYYVISSIPLYAYFDDGSLLPTGYVHYSCLAALLVLQMLHIYWAYLLLKVVVKAIVSGGVQGDVRDKDE